MAGAGLHLLHRLIQQHRQRAAILLLLCVELTGCWVSEARHNAVLRDLERVKATRAERDLGQEEQLKELEAQLVVRSHDHQKLREQLALLDQARREQEARSVELEHRLAQLHEGLERGAALPQQVFRTLQLQLFSLIQDGRAELNREQGVAVVQLDVDSLFEPKTAKLLPTGQATLDLLGRVLRTLPAVHPQVIGEPPPQPAGSPNFTRAWRLSCRRTMAIGQRLRQAGLSPTNLAVACQLRYGPQPRGQEREGVRLVLWTAEEQAAGPLKTADQPPGQDAGPAQ